jgi:hypothetical protein
MRTATCEVRSTEPLLLYIFRVILTLFTYRNSHFSAVFTGRNRNSQIVQYEGDLKFEECPSMPLCVALHPRTMHFAAANCGQRTRDRRRISSSAINGRLVQDLTSKLGLDASSSNHSADSIRNANIRV